MTASVGRDADQLLQELQWFDASVGKEVEGG